MKAPGFYMKKKKTCANVSLQKNCDSFSKMFSKT